jgi:hypothetical protein
MGTEKPRATLPILTTTPCRSITEQIGRNTGDRGLRSVGAYVPRADNQKPGDAATIFTERDRAAHRNAGIFPSFAKYFAKYESLRRVHADTHT